MLVEKKVFELPFYRARNGRIIKNVRIGWESYGELNADRTNAILIAHHFSGTSHAAGRYAPNDTVPGYWDEVIGPGKPLDTDRYFVFSSDTLCNLNVYDPHVVTTGPASIDPDTGMPYGLDFPVVTIADFVEVQNQLVESLGITKLHAVMGPSMGGLQTLAWAALFPERVGRIVPVICAGEMDAWLIAWLGLWAAPILADPAWKNGAYQADAPPIEGLRLALRLIGLHTRHWDWADVQFGRAWAQDNLSPAEALASQFKIETALEELAAARAEIADANHLLYLVRANQTFAAGPTGTLTDLERIRAKTLMLYAAEDQVFRQERVLATAMAISRGGASVQTAEIAGPYGHLNGLLGLAMLGPEIAAFLQS